MGMWNYLLRAANSLVSGIRPWRVISGVLVSAAITALGGFLILDKVKQPNLPEQQLASVSLIFAAFCLIGLFAGGIMIGWKTQRSWVSNIFLYFLAVAWAIPCLSFYFLNSLSFESSFTVFNTFLPITSAGLAAIFGGGALGRGIQLLLCRNRNRKASDLSLGKGDALTREHCDTQITLKVRVLNVSFLLLCLLAVYPIMPVFFMSIDDGARVLKRVIAVRPPLIDTTSQEVISGVVKYLLQQENTCRETSVSSASSSKEKYVVVDSRTEVSTSHISDAQLSSEFKETNFWSVGEPAVRGIQQSVSEHPEGFTVALPAGVPGKVIDIGRYECGPLTCPMKEDLWFVWEDRAWRNLLASYPNAVCWVSVWPVGFSSSGTKAIVRMFLGPTPHGAAATALLEKYYDGWKVTHYEPAYY